MYYVNSHNNYKFICSSFLIIYNEIIEILHTYRHNLYTDEKGLYVYDNNH